MKWYFKFIALALILTSCNQQNFLTVEDYLVTKSRNSYLIIDPGSLNLYIQDSAPDRGDSKIHLVYPLMNSSSKNALTDIDGVNSETSIAIEAWLWEGEKLDIDQSKVAYQRALVQKGGKWFIVQCQGGTKVSAYSFRDEMIKWGASSVLKLEYRGAFMGWYRYGGAPIDKREDLTSNPKPSAFLVVK